MTAQQAEEYLRNNPNAKIRSNNTGQVFGAEQPQPEKKGLLGLIDAILPVRKLSGQALDVGGFLGQNIAQGVGRGVFGEDFGGVQQVTGYDPEDWGEFQRRGGFTGTLGAGLNTDLSAFDLLNDAERQRLERAPILEGIKSGAQIASFAVPTLGTGLGGAIKTGAVSGGLGGFGASESINPVEALGQGATSAVAGGAISGAVYGIGKGIEKLGKIKNVNVADKLDNMADDLRTTSFKRTVGTAPSMGQGKYDLVRDVVGLSDELGVKIKSADDLYQFGDDILKNYGGLADDFAQQFDNTGNVINVAELKKPLVDKLNSVKSAELKAPLQRVLDSIDNATGGRGQISATELLQLRREWGDLGNWNKFTPASEQSIAKAFEEAYTSANNVLDTNLSKVGYKDFRNVNKALKTAIESKNWARRASATTSSAPVWTDMTQDAVMFGGAVAGGPGALASLGVTKGLQRYGEDIAQKGLGGVANILRGGGGKVPQAVSGVGSFLQNLASTPQVSSGIGALLSQPRQQSDFDTSRAQGTQTTQGYQGGIDYSQILAQVTLNLVDSGYSVAEASKMAEMLLVSEGIAPAQSAGGSGGKLTESQRQGVALIGVIDELDSMLESNPSMAGRVSGGVGGVERLFNIATPRTDYKTKIDALNSFLKTRLIGSAQSEAEIRGLKNLLIKETDSASIARQKMASIRSLLEAGVYGSDVGQIQ